jgi:hypothetical protein
MKLNQLRRGAFSAVWTTDYSRLRDRFSTKTPKTLVFSLELRHTSNRVSLVFMLFLYDIYDAFTDAVVRHRRALR